METRANVLTQVSDDSCTLGKIRSMEQPYCIYNVNDTHVTDQGKLIAGVMAAMSNKHNNAD